MKKTIRPLQRGFTLIELMIVVAIIGILATLALPAYQDYTIRARMAEVILASSKCRTNITEYYQLHKEFATDVAAPAAYGCNESNPTQYVKSIDVRANGVVEVTVNDVIGTSGLLALKPKAKADKSNIESWSCANTETTVEKKYLPASCR